MEDKLHCLCAEDGTARLQHPLSQSVRQLHLSKLSISELIQMPKNSADSKKETLTKAKGRPRATTPKEKTGNANETAANTGNEIIILTTTNKQLQTVNKPEA